MSVDIQKNLEHVRSRIGSACGRVGRSPDEVTLVAVTKTHPKEVIESAFQVGLRHFGENRVEEGNEKLPGLSEEILQQSTWHMIGTVQSRKAHGVLDYFTWVHSLDRIKLANRLDHFAADAGKRINGLLQVNISGEETKSGFDVTHWPLSQADLGHLFEGIDHISTLSNIRVRGLMTIAPYSALPEETRPVFRHMKELQMVLIDRYPDQDWSTLSMGMSSDFEVAIEEGATMIRLGTVLFGARN